MWSVMTSCPSALGQSGEDAGGRRAEVEQAMEGGVTSFVSEPGKKKNNLKGTWHSLGRGLPSENTWSSHHDFPFHISSPCIAGYWADFIFGEIRAVSGGSK